MVSFPEACLKAKIGLLVLACLSLATSMRAQTGSVVSVNTDNVLVVNGRKVFPIGFSPGPPTFGKTSTGADALQELRDAGGLLFRMVQTTAWDATVISNQQAALDWASRHGMYCWVNLRELSAFPTTDTNTPVALRNIVDTFRNHPALGLWKNFDEAWWGGVSATDLQNGYLVTRQEDTNHPVVQTHAPRGTVSDLQPYNAAADVLALDIYPVAIPPPTNPPLTNTAISVVGDWTLVLGQVAGGQKEFWTIEQIAFSGTTPPGHTLIFPTFTQSRYMAYQAIIEGARGLMFFGGNIAATLNAQDAPLGWNWTFWNNVLKPVVQQLGDHSVLAGALVTTNSTLPITIAGTGPPDLEFCAREVPPYLFILAGKREGSSTNVTFNGLPSWAATGEVLYESPRTVTAVDGRFSDTFAPFDVHVYRFSETNTPVTIIFPPQNQTNYTGTVVNFSVSAEGTGPLAYQWRRNGTNISDGGNISGAGTSSLALTNVSTVDAANYDVVVIGFGNVTSAPAALVVTNPPAQAIPQALLLDEPFDYPNVGGAVSLNAPSNWTFNGSGANDLNVAGGSLSYAGLAASRGNSVTNGGAGLGTRRLFSPGVSTGTVYFSALFRINDLGYGAWNGGASQVGALTASDNQSFRLQVLVKSNSPSGYSIGVEKGGTGVTSTFASTEYHAGDTVFLAGKYDYTISPNRVSLWINPSPSTFALSAEPATGFITANTGTDGLVIDRFNMRQNTASSVPAAMQWDELRIGLSWASVTPPLSIALINPRLLPNGAFQFEFTNTNAISYSVYSSSNLFDWFSNGPAPQISPGVFQFSDPAATNASQRFYQLRLP